MAEADASVRYLVGDIGYMYHRQKRIFLWILIGTGSISFTSCGRDAALYQESIGASSEGLQSGADEKPEQKGTGSGDGEETAPGEVPQLPETASELTGFVPEGWEILDSVELDFNEDGIPDYIGVLQAAMIDKGGYQAYQDDP